MNRRSDSPCANGPLGGFTLIEVTLALLILGVGVITLVAAASRCLATLRVSRIYHEARYAMDLGELEYPIIRKSDEVFNMNVDPVDLPGGLVFSRESEPSEQHEGLHVVRTRIEWSTGNRDYHEETFRYLYYTNDVP